MGTPAVDVVVSSRGGWRPVVTALRAQTRAPGRIIVESAAGPDGLPEDVVAARPGRGIAAAGAEFVAFLDDLDRPGPGWLEAVAAAAGTAPGEGPDVIGWGVLTVRADGIVERVDLPPVTAPAGRRPRPGTAVRRAALTDGRLARDAGATGIARLLVTRRPAGSVPASAETGDPLLVSVVLPVRDAASTLGEQLAALAAQDYAGRWELVVVDNGSTDRSMAVVEERRRSLPALRTIAAPGARSAGVARNAGVRACAGALVLFCDADDVADPGWISAMVAALAEADMAGGRVECAVLNPGLAGEEPAQLPDQGEALPFARSANCGIRRSVLTAVGGWAETFAGGAGEDVDLSWRVQLAGYRLVYAPAARMGYRLRADLPGLARQKWAYGLTGALLYRTFRNAGYRRRPWRAVLLSWLWMIRHLPDLARRGMPRRRWIRYAARLAGFAAGSLRHRAAYF
ncbi:glycosyltransferase [Actinoplanes sp. NBRC 101535]|uniref:glycosyltransferase n=1 Tax=Actinoplanes sp. NBRC 101535 TaxID=3032196 RepID=UPI00249F9E2E|nr:glycosyltransferase [Actinoplanes sp. NBRC 101535]GLY08380.1 hypothetical protein Acsp01_87590 [Actinoplanes sp. NBRC 101535]